MRYDEICGSSSPCSINFDIPERMEQPIYFYYRLTRFYQNHRRYAKSFNQGQLSGSRVTSFASLADCDPLKSVNDSQEAQNFYYPCGLIANSLFNGIFSFPSSLCF